MGFLPGEEKKTKKQFSKKKADLDLRQTLEICEHRHLTK